MSATQRTAPTPHGDVGYETVTCTSCDNEVAKEDAKRFVIGDVKERFLGEIRFDRSQVDSGWACPFCAEDGPAEFPSRGRVVPRVNAREVTVLAMTALLCVLALAAVARLLGVLG